MNRPVEVEIYVKNEFITLKQAESDYGVTLDLSALSAKAFTKSKGLEEG